MQLKFPSHSDHHLSQFPSLGTTTVTDFFVLFQRYSIPVQSAIILYVFTLSLYFYTNIEYLKHCSVPCFVLVIIHFGDCFSQYTKSFFSLSLNTCIIFHSINLAYSTSFLFDGYFGYFQSFAVRSKIVAKKM